MGWHPFCMLREEDLTQCHSCPHVPSVHQPHRTIAMNCQRIAQPLSEEMLEITGCLFPFIPDGAFATGLAEATLKSTEASRAISHVFECSSSRQ